MYRKDKKLEKKVKRIRKENPLYFIDGNGGFRKLENVSTRLLDKILVSFLIEGDKERYDRLNRDAIMGGKSLAPISYPLKDDFHDEFDFIVTKFFKNHFGKKDISIFYGSTKVPFVRVYKLVE